MAPATYDAARPLATTPSGLEMHHATSQDLESMSDLYFRSFAKSHPLFQKMMPIGSENLSWWRAAHSIAIDDQPNTIVLVIRDPQATDADKVVCLARWVRAAPRDGDVMSDGYGGEEGDEQTERWPEFGESVDANIAGTLFGSFEVHRKKLVGSKRHYYLELLCTDVDYWGQGAGALAVKYGCDMADEEDVECYVDSSPMAWPLYERFGFEMKMDQRMPDVEGQGYVESFAVRKKASERRREE